MDNQTLGVIAAVVVIVGSVVYLKMGGGVSSEKPTTGKEFSGSDSKKKDEAQSKAEVCNLIHIKKYIRPICCCLLEISSWPDAYILWFPDWNCRRVCPNIDGGG